MAVLVSGYIQHFTYAGLLVVLVLCGMGLPVPEDIALLAGGFLVHRGVIRYPVTLAISLVGVVAGDNSLYLIGRRFGIRLLNYIDRPGSRWQLDKLREMMRRHGSKTILYARFFAGVRAIVYLSAGSLEITWRQFALYDLLGALISVPIVVSLGYIFGDQLETLIAYVGGIERVLALIAILSVSLYLTRFMTFPGGNRSAP